VPLKGRGTRVARPSLRAILRRCWLWSARTGKRHPLLVAYLDRARVRASLGLCGARIMDPIIARLDIEHFRKFLTVETVETKRRTILRLPAEEEAKLEQRTTLPRESGLSRH
jgi:hypothetical protein